MAQMSDSRDTPADMSDEEPPQLPLEVLIHIMSYLSVPDRLAAGLVNRTWRRASLAPEFIDQEQLCIGKSSTNSANKILDMLCNCTRPYFHISFTQIEIARLMQIWHQHGPCFRSLVLSACDITEKALVEILKTCTTLRSLHFDNCQNFLISGRLLEDENDIKELSDKFQNLLALRLTYNRFLSDMLFNRLVAICPNLDSLSVMGCQISFHAGLYKKFYPEDSMSKSEGSKSVLTFKNVVYYLEKQAAKLKHLDLSCTLVDSNALNTLCALKDLKLDTLALANCQQLSLAGIRGLSQHQTSLQALDLSRCVRFTDASLVCICKNLTNLEYLNLELCRAITDVGVQHIRKLRRLRYLNISLCEQLTGKCITRGICWDVPSETEDNVLIGDDDQQLAYDAQDLQDERSTAGAMLENKYFRSFAANIVNLSEESIEYICLCFPNLTLLDFSLCNNAVTDKTLQIIFKELVHLKTLILFGCERISDAGITGMSLSNQRSAIDIQADNLAEPVESRLRISLRSRAEEEIIRDAARKRDISKIRNDISISSNLHIPPGYSIMRLKGLRKLDLSSCTRITDDSLEHAFYFPELQTLNLSECDQLSDIGLEYLTRNSRAIEDLNLQMCSRLTDTGITYIARRLKRLKRLQIMGCAQLTDHSLNELYLHSKSLQYLDVRLCVKMTSAGFDRLKDVYVERTKFVNEEACGELAPVPNPPPMPSFPFFKLS